MDSHVIAKTLSMACYGLNAPEKAYIVGGFVRDGLLGETVNDIDVVVRSDVYEEFKGSLLD